MYSLKIAIVLAACAWCITTACFAQQQQPPQKPPKKEEAKPKVTLQGGIERLVGNSMLTGDIVLYKQTPRLAKVAPLKAGADGTLLKSGTEESSYPDYLVGHWGGTLKVVWAAHTFKEAPPQLRIDNPGLVVFNFEKTGQSVYLHPTLIFFPRETHWANDAWMQNTPVRAYDLETVQRMAREGGMVSGIPALELGGGRARFMNGDNSTSRIVRSTLKTLRRGTVEHDLVIANWRGSTFTCYEEIISRFTWYAKNRVYVQIGSAQFDENRRAISREILAGWVDSDWWPTANEISLMHGRSWEQVLIDNGIR